MNCLIKLHTAAWLFNCQQSGLNLFNKQFAFYPALQCYSQRDPALAISSLGVSLVFPEFTLSAYVSHLSRVGDLMGHLV